MLSHWPQVKCEQYLPEGEPRRFGEVGVAVLRTTPRDGYTLRELALEVRALPLVAAGSA